MNKAMTVLVVEDDMPIRNLISTTLKTHDYKFLTAKDGNDAISSTVSFERLAMLWPVPAGVINTSPAVTVETVPSSLYSAVPFCT